MKGKNTKEKLLESTLKLISEKGYLGATTREIAQEAGVTELTLFRHFGTKEKLFEGVMNNYTFLPRLKKLLPDLENVTYKKALTVVGERFLETLQERRSMVKIMLSEINIYPEKIRKVYNRSIHEIIKTLAGYFSAQQNEGKIRRISPEMTSRAFLGMIFSYFQAEGIVKNRSISKKEIGMVIESFVDVMINGTRKS